MMQPTAKFSEKPDVQRGHWDFDITSKRLKVCPDCKSLLDVSSLHVKITEIFSLLQSAQSITLVRAYRFALQQNEAIDLKLRIEDTHGRTKWLRVTGILSYQRWGKPDRLVGMVEDITQKVTEDSLGLAVVNHELRGPLTIIKLNTQRVIHMLAQKQDEHTVRLLRNVEYHLFSSIVGLMATAKINSLIFLDEPESSLHPNWQMKYLSFIRELFSSEEYGTSHIIVATHSHYLISDLKGHSSKIIGLRRAKETHEKNDRRSEIVDLPYDMDTFGWSAEEVLLKVFNVPTTRNYYVADKVGEILELVSQSNRDDILIKERVGVLIKHNIQNLSKEDPLKPVIDRLIEKYG